jgi:F-type H+-transporting ATPase subunit alpha
VSRVGGNAQIKAMKQVAGTLRLAMAQYRELAAFAQFGSDLDKATQAQLARGPAARRDPQAGPVRAHPVERQVVIIYAAPTDPRTTSRSRTSRTFEAELNRYLDVHHKDIARDLA